LVADESRKKEIFDSPFLLVVREILGATPSRHQPNHSEQERLDPLTLLQIITLAKTEIIVAVKLFCGLIHLRTSLWSNV
jgi:hypothetical protein